MTERKTRCLPRDSRGITLIELMIVLVVVATGVLALSGVQTRTSGVVHATGRHGRAVQLAQLQMEAARSAGFALARPDSGASGVFVWRTAVDSADVGLNRVQVTVEWAESGQQRSVQLHGLLAMR